MAANWHGTLVVGVSLHEKGVKPVNLEGNCVHDGLTVGGTVVEKHVEQRLVGKVTQASSAGQGDFLYPPDREKKIDSQLLFEHFLMLKKLYNAWIEFRGSTSSQRKRLHNIVVLLLLWVA